MDINVYSRAAGVVVSYKNTYETMLFNELNKSCAGIKLVDRSDGAAVFSVPDYSQLVNAARDNQFVFLQHMHPFMCSEVITGEQNDMEIIRKMSESILEIIDKEATYVCQCRIVADKEFAYSNADITACVSEYMETNGVLISPEKAECAVSLTIFNGNAYMGVSRLCDNVSEWCGGVLFYAKSEDIICRAEFKLEEAFRHFDIGFKPESQALDLGAAPGGWTHFLAGQGIYVDAVDPANLDERVLANSHVTHSKMTAQEHIRKYPDKQYDIIVNDMKMDTNESVDIFCEVSSQLKSGGIGVLTLKLPKDKITKRLQVARTVLERHFTTVVFKQLYYNRSEVTAYVIK